MNLKEKTIYRRICELFNSLTMNGEIKEEIKIVGKSFSTILDNERLIFSTKNNIKIVGKNKT